MRYIIVLKCQLGDQQRLGLESSASYLRNCASQGVQEENSREGNCNLGVLLPCVLPLNSVL